MTISFRICIVPEKTLQVCQGYVYFFIKSWFYLVLTKMCIKQFTCLFYEYTENFTLVMPPQTYEHFSGEKKENTV